MGIAPATRERDEFVEVLKRGVFPGSPSLENRSILYLDLALQQGPRSGLLQKAAEWYRANHWDAAFVLGNELVGTVIKANPKTAQDAVDVYIRCLNLLEAPTFHFEFRRWDHQTRGNLEFAIPILEISQGR